MLIIGRPSRGGCSLFANNGGDPVVSGLLISPRVYALDGETGRLAPAITKFFIQKHCREQRRIYGFRFDGYKSPPLYCDSVEYPLDKALPLLVTDPWVKPKGPKVI